ncbi:MULTISPECIES: M28 family peptidase [Bizionia]|uniref:Vacuolar membrane protease n=1 Tax=Bizionia algoritergicola TaxID=291187 RepID=A0A5D0R3W8_9FLAO|nr:MULTISPECIES: M28 family peptidase [Bizionia]OBX24396.1 peptidase M28 [Bizionia sp. APA-3]TYB75318.1 M28 family peptidase [Bizionia algoritergicola]
MFKKLLALILIAFAVYWSFSVLLPQNISTLDAPENEFSTERALAHLKEISKAPHYLGHAEHTRVRNYIIQQLEALGLETEVQEAFSITKWGNLSKPKNIIARYKGEENGKALLLLTHYDSQPHSSFGASDAGSGVVTILESLRAFLSENKQPKNDIIIVISDAEELGLNGADIFVNKHPWAKDVGLVLNFEARGSGGPSYMLIETNQGNAELMKHFVAANPEYPVANSLAYSIYKMLPNDTDLTRFREDGNIDGFNFAFIDDHFDYHTALDTYERLDRNTLEHQGSYLMPLLHYFSDANLSSVKSTEDYIYFNAPLFKTVIYPFSWIFPMLILGFLGFIALLIYGFKREAFIGSEIGRGFAAFFLALLSAGGIGFGLWFLIKLIYPQYGEMLHGFTYNGHVYIFAFTFLALAICFWVYHKFHKPENTASLFVAPLFFWLVICTLVAFLLPGASFFIIPVFFGLTTLFVLIRQKKPNLILLALLGFPVLTIMVPFIKMFPVGLGLKILFVSCILVVLIFGMLVSVFGFFKHKKLWSYVFLGTSILCLVIAHFKSDFSEDRPRPNSLNYVLDSNTNTAVWATYDDALDSYTQPYLTDSPDDASLLNQNTMGSKYKSGFTFTKTAPVKALENPEITILSDTIIGENRNITLQFKSNRHAERVEVFADSTNIFKDAMINGIPAIKDDASGHVFADRYNNRLFSYYVSENEPLDMQLIVPKNQKTTLQVYEATYNLLTNSHFTIPGRTKAMIPKPFVLNDAVIIKSTVTIK